MDNSGQIPADQSANNVDTKDQAHEVSDGNEDSTGKWIWGHECHILAKKLSSSCLFPKTLCEGKFKHSKQINLVEVISRQSDIHTVAWVLLAAFRQIYNQNQELKSGTNSMKNVQFCQKGNTFKVQAKESMAAEKINAIKKKPSIYTGTTEKIPWAI